MIILYMNKNHFTTKTALQLAKILEYDDLNLKEIGLKWNNIDGQGGEAIARGLKVNKCLKMLDLSWNKMGVKRGNMKVGDIGKAWGEAFKENETLIHIDISFNKFQEEDTEILAKDLEENQTIMGIHYQGNTSGLKSDNKVGKLDSLGFINMINNKESDPMEPHLLMSIHDGGRFNSINRRMQSHEVPKAGIVNADATKVHTTYRKFGKE